jgi:hypothetical protein
MDHPYLDLFLAQELVGLQPPPPEDEFAGRGDPDGVEQAELLDAGGQAPEVAQVGAEGPADDDVLDLAPFHECDLYHGRQKTCPPLRRDRFQLNRCHESCQN